MDDPADLLTNQYEIVGIDEVFWDFYEFTTSADSDGHHDSAASQLNYFRIESQLRTYGILVLLDLDNRGVWAFHLSIQSRKDLPRLISLFDISLRANGSIRVTQLVGLYSGDHRSGNLFTPERTSDEHTRLFKPPGMDEQHLRPQFRAPSASSIYGSFIGAIRRSLAFSLGQQPGWVLFGGDSCLNEGTIGFKTMSDPRFTEIVSFTCRWTATGALIIQSLSNDIAKVHRISDLYPPDEIEKSYGQVVLAFPQQAVGTVVGRSSPKKRGHEVSIDSMHQAYTKDCLQGLNVSIEAWDSWIRIHTSEADIDIGLTGGSEGLPQRRNLEIIWPSKLCLCTTPRHMLESLKRTLNPDSDIMDPIERAEAWFNHSVHSAKADGETGKADIVTADRKDTEDANNTMTKEQLSPLGQRNLFDSSTVYPTPPDGVQSYSHNTPMPENALEGVDERNTAAFRANARQNVPPENQDLFGEHEMDLTEADFEFFDEPGFQNQPTVSDRSYLKGKVQLSGDVDLTGGPSIPTIPDANSNVQAQSQDRKVDVVLEDEIMRDIATLATPVSMLTVENSSPQACKDDVQVNNLKRRHEPDAEPETTASESSTPSDFSVAVSGRADMDLDTKYSERGPYGYVPSRVSSSSHQTPINRSTKQILPQMGLAEGSISDSDESDGKWSKASMSGSFNWLKEYEVDISPEPSSPASSENDEATERQHMDHVTLKTSVQTIWPFIQQSWIASQNFGSPANKQIITAEGKETIELAQIVIDHAITTLSYEDPLLELFQDVPEIQGPIGARHLDLISKLIGQFLSPADAKPLREVMVTGAARTTASSEHVREPADLLELPNVNLRRMNVSLSVLPSAVMFWEELGLEPLNCQKHVLSLCLSVRKRLYLQRPIGAFLEQMRDVYQGCQLGHHEAISDQEHFQNVLDEDGPGKLGSALGQHGSKELFYVIYLLNEVAQPAPLALCEMCQEIMDGYRNEPGRSTSFGLVVQIVPLRMVYDSRCPAIPPVDVLRKLALEVYDRCGPVNESASFDLAPAVALSQPLPDKIDFQLTADSSAVKLFHDNCLHIAYVWEPTCQWMTVTWIDNTGNLQWNASYWVGEDEKTWQEFGSAVYEIIETTGLMIGSSGLPRRIFVVKQNRFLREELKAWQLVASNADIKPRLSFNFFVIDPHPALQLSPPPVELQPEEESADQPMTPASIPLAAGNSPEVSSAATPGPSGSAGFDQDSEARLIDARDDTWVLYPKVSIDDPFLPSPFCPSKKSAYLLKRGGGSEIDGFFPLAVSLVQTSEKGNEGLMQEVLEMYHKLALLARIRGLTNVSTGVLPLHMAAASKAYSALSTTMQWQPKEEEEEKAEGAE